MDNVTHSLAGLLLAESSIRLRVHHTGHEPSRRFRATAVISSMIAANLPDADLFYTGVGGDRLAYMLHHRGHTHTIVAAIAGAVLVWAIALLALRRRAEPAVTSADRRWLLGLFLVSMLSHLVLDWTNSYGVHLFWPLENRWSYGDSVFIVEPWFWVVTVPVLVAASTTRTSRVLLSLPLLLALILAWRVDLISRGAAVGLTAGAALSIGLARVLRPGARAAAALAAWVAVTLVMAAGAAEARQSATRAVRAADPAAELLDVVVTPMPANAVCMTVLTVERSGERYRVATARVTSAPSITDASRCGTLGVDGPMFAPSVRPSTPAVRWVAEWSAPQRDLAMLARESCRALAALRFIRAPVWRALDDSTVVLGDARFGGGSGNSFSDVRVSRRSSACPAAVPPWVPPRADLLSSQSGGGS